MRRDRDGYCLMKPNGDIVPSTFDTGKNECWVKSFEYLSSKAWMKPFWKQWDASIKEAENRGWRMVPAFLIPVVEE